MNKRRPARSQSRSRSLRRSPYLARTLDPELRLNLAEQVFSAADRSLRSGKNPTFHSLMDSYHSVLRSRGINPAKDTTMYKLILKLNSAGEATSALSRTQDTTWRDALAQKRLVSI